MLIFVAVALLFVLPSPWNLVGFLVTIPLWVGELLAWNRTVKKRRKVRPCAFFGADWVDVAASEVG